MLSSAQSRRIKVLRESVAQKIAAGEVIDRPAAIIRELIDNALDAEASEIHIRIEKGGLSRIRVIDNGVGMGVEDLSLCYLPHATSKIEHENDLQNITSLGFRGEALASIAACSHLTITSKTEEDRTAHTLTAKDGKKISLKPGKGTVGTVVEVTDLFHSFPARKKFLKSAQAESSMCRTVFIEKAAAFPNIAFRLFVDDRLKFFLPSGSDRDRLQRCFPEQVRQETLFSKTIEKQMTTITIIGAPPELRRKDRKLLQIFVNRRRIFDYSLIQAVEYAYSHYIPGGYYPIAFVFLTLPSEQIDFNIHPAKKEVRFRDIQKIHHEVVLAVREALTDFGISVAEEKKVETWQSTPKQGFLDSFPSTLASRPTIHSLPIRDPELSSPHRPQAGVTFCYKGQLFNLYLLAETDQSLYIIDQHAAHERVLYEQYRIGPIVGEQLLVPYRFSVTPFEEQVLSLHLEQYRQLGVALKRESPGTWTILSLPGFTASPDQQMIDAIRESARKPDQLEHVLFTTYACKQAVKEGVVVDVDFANMLIEKVFSLSNARCPHGRPIWYSLTEKELGFLVGRT